MGGLWWRSDRILQSFRKVILKNDQQQTKSKKSQKVPGYEPL
jgi:hypothetical protein